MASSLAIYKEDREKLQVKAAPLLPKGSQALYRGAMCLLGQGWGRGREAAVPDSGLGRVCSCGFTCSHPQDQDPI